jgi:hypothetical protein
MSSATFPARQCDSHGKHIHIAQVWVNRLIAPIAVTMTLCCNNSE